MLWIRQLETCLRRPEGPRALHDDPRMRRVRGRRVVHQGASMKTIRAKVLDPTHLELSQAIDAPPGQSIQITIPDPDEGDLQWREESHRRFLDAYDAGDAIYDAV